MTKTNIFDINQHIFEVKGKTCTNFTRCDSYKHSSRTPTANSIVSHTHATCVQSIEFPVLMTDYYNWWISKLAIIRGNSVIASNWCGTLTHTDIVCTKYKLQENIRSYNSKSIKTIHVNDVCSARVFTKIPILKSRKRIVRGVWESYETSGANNNHKTKKMWRKSSLLDTLHCLH